jgi:transcriptional regulator with XRE-family HTH domain
MPDIAEILKRMETTLKELAKDIQTSNRTLNAILSGKSSPPEFQRYAARRPSHRNQIKIRGDAKLKNLPGKKQAQIFKWIMGDLTLLQIRDKVRVKFKISVSISTLSGFYAWYFETHLRSKKTGKFKPRID